MNDQTAAENALQPEIFRTYHRATGRIPRSALCPVLDHADFLGDNPDFRTVRQPLGQSLPRRFRFVFRGEAKLRLLFTEQDRRPFVDQRFPALLRRHRVTSADGGNDLIRQHTGRVRFWHRQSAGEKLFASAEGHIILSVVS